MSSDAQAHGALIAALTDQLRRFSITAALTCSAVAERLAINDTDLRCMLLFPEHQEVSAGDLAALSGLSTGAVTGLLDRLEKAGLVERTKDPDDRRRVVVRQVPEALEKVKQGWQRIHDGMVQMWNELSDDEIRFLTSYFERTDAIMTAEMSSTQAAQCRRVARSRRNQSWSAR